MFTDCFIKLTLASTLFTQKLNIKAMFKLGLLVCLMLLAVVEAREVCVDSELNLSEQSNLAEKLFYRGTCHYRNGDYHLAANNWRGLADLEQVDPNYKDLQISALSNLAYLMFFGLNIEADQPLALEYWGRAVAMGNKEAQYHLCHAQADKDAGSYNPKLALPHCLEAFQIYNSVEEKDESDLTILKQIEFYIESIEAKN